MRSQFPSARGALARRFFGGNKLLNLVPSVHIAVKSGFLNFASCFAFRGDVNPMEEYVFISQLGFISGNACIMAMLH